MNYLVVLDVKSPIGEMYAAVSDTLRTDGPVRHPILVCTELDASNHHYLHVKRSLASIGKTFQILDIPHSSVIQIVHYGNDEKPPGAPFGFAAVKSPGAS